MKWNESGFRPLLCTYRLNWARRTSWGWWDEMTLPSRHRIRNSNPRGLRPSTLPLGHGGSTQYWVLGVDGEETFLFLSNRRDRGTSPGKRTPNSGVKGSDANHYPRAPAPCHADNIPANTRRWTNVVSMLGKRRRRWVNIKATVVQRLVFNGIVSCFLYSIISLL